MIAENYKRARKKSLELCLHLSEEELKLQPESFVSPPLWHLGHTSWLFETVILQPKVQEYELFDRDFPYKFNSYYKQIGEHCPQDQRGKLNYNKKNIIKYHKYVDQHLLSLIKNNKCKDLEKLITTAINHEEQHQELLVMDILAIKTHLNTPYPIDLEPEFSSSNNWMEIKEGIAELGKTDGSFHYDNESPRHKHYQYPSSISTKLVSNLEYKEFISAGAYKEPKYWLSKAWDWVQENQIEKPLYWDNKLDPNAPIRNISYYEADAFANFVGMRLPTEVEHELFDSKYPTKKQLWAWTSTQYGPYPGFKKFDGSLGEYNAKFMCNQFVLRGGCFATPDGHWRPSYRNFYEPQQRWQFTGIRLAKD